jgi:glutathione reductase (NADPH)
MLQAYDFDLFTIGAGSGGVRASRIAASYGAKVAIAEEHYLGGTCVNVGCIPKKLLVYASEFSEALEDAGGFGWAQTRPHFDWHKLIANKDREIERLNGVYERLLLDAGARIIRHRARLLDAHTIAVNGERLTARYVLIATGSWPTIPQVPGAELAITSNEAFHLPHLPRRILIIGGGYVGVEFACIFNGLQAQVTQVHRGALFLRGFDDDLRRALADEMRSRGIELRFGTTLSKLGRTQNGIVASLSDGTQLEVDMVMFCTGRHPNSSNLGLENAGVQCDPNGAIVVNECSQTSTENIYAVGDVTNRRNLTPVAIAEGHAVAELLFGGRHRVIDYENVPSAVFSQPPIATVGLTETAARARYPAIEVYKSVFRPLKHTLSGRNEHTVMKLVVEPTSGRVIGAHMIGPDAAEIIQGLAIALKAGATKAQFDTTIGIHPTAAEEFVTMREKSV